MVFGLFATAAPAPPPAPEALPDDGALATLASTLEGTLLKYGDAGYDLARTGGVWAPEKCRPGGRAFGATTHPTETWNLDAAQLPAAIAVIASREDVVRCVKYCAAAGIPCGVAGGRHSHTCLPQSAFVVDLQALRACALGERAGAKVLRCDGGALNGDANQALDGSGLGLTLGQHPGTGVGGLVQQGGHGLTERTLGLSVDSLVEATVVTAAGELVVASAESHADLLWALKGGCGNFGVVVEFVFALQPFRQRVPSITRVHLPIPLLCPSRLALVKHFRDNCEAAPRDVSPLLVLTPVPVIESYHGVGAAATLGDLEAYEAFGRPVASTREVRDYFSGIGWDVLGPKSEDNLAGYNYPTSSLLGAFPDEACEVVAAAAKRMPAGCSLILQPLGGAAADVQKDATAVYHRDAAYWVVAVGNWTRPAGRAKAVAWARGVRDELMPFVVGRYGMLGEDAASEKWGDLGDAEADPLIHASWGANYPKLQRVKKQYDRNNMFRFNHNVVPAP